MRRSRLPPRSRLDVLDRIRQWLAGTSRPNPWIGAAEAQAAKEKDRFDRQLEIERMVGRVFNLWFIRYPAAVVLLIAVWWYVDSGALGDDEWVIIILWSAAIGFALWWTREVSKWLLGIGLIVWLGSCANDRVDTMSSSEAILIGAIIIAYAVYASGGRK